jgi:hypothetical protein
VSLLLAASGVASLAVARERWWPACKWGDFDATACVRAQAHELDTTAESAVLQTVALVLMALAVACLPLLWSRRPVALITLATGALTVAFVAVAVATYLSVYGGWLFHDFPGSHAAAVTVALGWPLYLMVAMAVVLAGPYAGIWQPGTGWRLLFLLLLLTSTPLAQLVVTPMVTGYGSYDTAPWTDAVSGALLLCAALVVWPAAAPRRARRMVMTGRVPASTLR